MEIENFEIHPQDSKSFICTICQAKLSRGSTKYQLRNHLKTKKHLAIKEKYHEIEKKIIGIQNEGNNSYKTDSKAS